MSFWQSLFGTSEELASPKFVAKLSLESLDCRIVPDASSEQSVFIWAESVRYHSDPLIIQQNQISSLLTVEQQKAKPKPNFDKIEELTDILNKNKTAKAILDRFIKAGGKSESGPSISGGEIQLPEDPKNPIKIVIDPTPGRTESKQDAVGVLLLELIRWDNMKEQKDLLDQRVAGKMTDDEYAIASEKLSYKYNKLHHDICTEAIKNGEWDNAVDIYADLLKDFDTFEKFLVYQKKTGHYGDTVANIKAYIQNLKK